MTVQKLALFSLLGAGAIGGSAAGIYHFSQNKTTIRDKLTEKGTKLISNQDEYEVAFIELKSKSEFKTTIGNIQDTTTFQVGGAALKTWCEENLELKLTNKDAKDKLPRVEEYCSKPSLDIEARFKKARKTLVADSGWKDKYQKVKQKQPADNAFDTEIKFSSIVGVDDQNTKGGKALQKWCNENIKTKLTNDKEEKTWKKVVERCLNES